MINPASVVRLLQEKEKFGQRQPLFVGFMGELLRSPMKPGDVIRVSYIQPDGKKKECDLNIIQDDITILNEIGRLFK